MHNRRRCLIVAATLAGILLAPPGLCQDRKGKQESANQGNQDCWSYAADQSRKSQEKARKARKKGEKREAAKHAWRAFGYEAQGAACTLALVAGIAALAALGAAAAGGGGGDEPPPMPQDDLNARSMEEIRESVEMNSPEVVDLAQQQVPSHEFVEEAKADLRRITELIQRDP